jgi:peroxiredoxin
MKKLPYILAGCVWLAVASPVYCADPKVELQELMRKVENQLQSGKATPQDLAPDLQQFDALLAEHKGEKTDDVADILFMKGMLYTQVLNDDAKAKEALEQVKAQFPGTADAKKVDLVFAALAQQAEAKKVQATLVVGSQFPDFNETDLDGKPLSVANDKGKVVLIDFWATWCGPCVHELPNVLKVYEKDHDKGFDIIGVSLDSEKEKLTTFIKQQNMTWPQYFDGKGWENKLSTKYGVVSIPATYLLGKDGKIIGKDLRGDALDNAVTAALAAN